MNKPHTGGTSGRGMSSMCNSVRTLSEKLNKIIDDSNEIGREIAVSWCISPQSNIRKEYVPPIKPYESNFEREVTKMTDISIGDKTSCKIPAISCNKPKLSAYLHTHPSGDRQFSIIDYNTMFGKNKSISCLGTKDDEGKNNVLCDVIDVDDEQHKHIAQEINYLYKESIPIINEFLKDVENGESRLTIDRAYSEYRNSYYEVTKIINKAIADGIIKRCSVASNMLE